MYKYSVHVLLNKDIVGMTSVHTKEEIDEYLKNFAFIERLTVNVYDNDVTTGYAGYQIGEKLWGETSIKWINPRYVG